MQRVTIHETIVGQGLTSSSTRQPPMQTWIGSEQVELEKVQTFINLDPYGVSSMIQPTMIPQLQTTIRNEIPNVIAQDIQAKIEGPLMSMVKNRLPGMVASELPNLVKTEIATQIKDRVKELIKEGLKLDIIFWRDEDGIGLTAQAILDGEVLVEQSKEVPNVP